MTTKISDILLHVKAFHHTYDGKSCVFVSVPRWYGESKLLTSDLFIVEVPVDDKLKESFLDIEVCLTEIAIQTGVLRFSISSDILSAPEKPVRAWADTKWCVLVGAFPNFKESSFRSSKYSMAYTVAISSMFGQRGYETLEAKRDTILDSFMQEWFTRLNDHNMATGKYDGTAIGPLGR